MTSPLVGEAAYRSTADAHRLMCRALEVERYAKPPAGKDPLLAALDGPTARWQRHLEELDRGKETGNADTERR